MIDIVSSEKRSWMMSRVSGKNTKPEIQVRSILHKMGCRFRLHNRNLKGSPDIVLKKYSAVIFVHGCFWHRHKNCRKTTFPKNNAEFWAKKFAKNIKRDKNNCKLLKNKGWKVLIVWECELEDLTKLGRQISRFLKPAKPNKQI